MKKSEMLSMKIGEEVENINISLEEHEMDKIEKLRRKLHKKNKKK